MAGIARGGYGNAVKKSHDFIDITVRYVYTYNRKKDWG